MWILLYETEESISKNIITEIHNRSFHPFNLFFILRHQCGGVQYSAELCSVFTIHGLNNNVRDFGYFAS